MNDLNSQSTSHCPACGSSLPADSPQGLCAACLLAGALEPTVGGEDPKAAPSPLNIATVQAAFPQFEIVELVGAGGMGAVYKARQPQLDRFVALKILTVAEQDPRFAERFQQEARTLARLNHPNIVTVFDYGEADGHYFLVMEFVEGLNLRQIMKAERLAPKQALAIVPSICEALQYAHDQGVVHRDIKPENILMDQSGRVKIADFGIARLLGSSDGGSTASFDTGAQDSVSLTNELILGTPSYMAPEQGTSPEAVDHRADIYSLGVVFYEMLTGERPNSTLTPPSQLVEVDVKLDEIVLRALAKQPELRFQSAAEFTRTLSLATPRGDFSSEDASSSFVTKGIRPWITAGAALLVIAELVFLGGLAEILLILVVGALAFERISAESIAPSSPFSRLGRALMFAALVPLAFYLLNTLPELTEFAPPQFTASAFLNISPFIVGGIGIGILISSILAGLAARRSLSQEERDALKAMPRAERMQAGRRIASKSKAARPYLLITKILTVAIWIVMLVILIAAIWFLGGASELFN